MFYPQQYFEQAIASETAKDSLLNLALNGAEGKYGFLDIIDEYSGTKAANLATYSAGMAYLSQQNYQEAISYLENFSSDDAICSKSTNTKKAPTYHSLALKNIMRTSLLGM